MSDADLMQTSVEQDGRILTGVGVSEDALEATMERHAPPDEVEPPQPAAAGTPAPSAEPIEKESRGKKRFAQLTGEREEAKRRAEAAEKERDELKARLEAAERSRTQPVASSVGPGNGADPSRPVQPVAAPAEKFKFPGYVEYLETHPDADYDNDYQNAKLEAHGEWLKSRLNLDAQIRDRIEADRASRILSDHVTQAKERGRKVYPDFDAVLAQAAHASANNWPVDKLRAIASLPEPEHVQYALAKNPELAERLRMEADPVAFGMALARLVPADSTVVSPASTGVRPVLNLPTPYQPVASGSKTTALTHADIAAKGGQDYDNSGWREKRDRDLGRKPRSVAR